MIVIVDYGVGNLFSLRSSLKFIGAEVEISNDKEKLAAADKIILPGVGAFGDAKDKLAATGLIPQLDKAVASGKPLLGICLGMQLLFDKGFEYGEHKGLGYIGGQVVAMEKDLRALGSNLKVPEIGWNSLVIDKPQNPLMKNSKQGDFVYYVHSFYAKCEGKNLVAYSDYGVKVAGVVASNNVFGCQFHPEKSGEAGLRILRAFCSL